jgi:hypothetical protein
VHACTINWGAHGADAHAAACLDIHCAQPFQRVRWNALRERREPAHMELNDVAQPSTRSQRCSECRMLT